MTFKAEINPRCTKLSRLLFLIIAYICIRLLHGTLKIKFLPFYALGLGRGFEFFFSSKFNVRGVHSLIEKKSKKNFIVFFIL